MKPKKILLSNKEGKRRKDRSVQNPRRQRDKRSSIHYWLAWILMLALFFIFLFIFGENGLLQTGELKRMDFILTEEINGLIKENEVLKREIKGLREDPFYVERVAREDLDLVKPNEVVYHFVSTDRIDERRK